MRFGDDELIERLLANQDLIRLPLVRNGNQLAVGPDETAWKRLLPVAD